jgi:glycosyltransferase involved in cell wall biosynthesis
MSDAPAVQDLLSQATFTPIYQDWLPVRDAELAARLRPFAPAKQQNILLLNATLGLQLYPSIVDFFVILQKVQPKVHVISASYFDHIHEFGPAISRRGLRVVPISVIESRTVDQLNQFDLILAIGPSTILGQLMSMPGLKTRLVCLDLAFYHELIHTSQDAFLRGAYVNERKSEQKNPVVCYSCQSQHKFTADVHRIFNLDAFSWQWFNYIPVGFTYGTYYSSDRQLFDVALLGTEGRHYEKIDPALFHGRKFLFLGNAERAPEITRLASQIDMTVVSRVDEDTYARLLALCRCVVLPLDATGHNVLLSVSDSIAAGKPLVTPRQRGLDRMADENAPITFFDDTPADLHAQVEGLLRDEATTREISARAITYAKEHLDMYSIIERILREQLP